MSLSRRTLLRSALAASCAVVPGFAFSQKSLGLPTTLVEIFNFRCSRSRGVSDWSSKIQAAATEVGVGYRPAPISWEAQYLWVDRFYYATRELYPEVAQLIRESLFSGIHDTGQAFEDLPQIMAYLQTSKTDVRAAQISKEFNLVDLLDRAQSDDTLYPIAKVVRLLELTNAQEVPIFLWVTGGEIAKVISPSDASEPHTLARRVIAELGASKTS